MDVATEKPGEFDRSEQLKDLASGRAVNQEIRVQIVGNSSRLSLGVKRYVGDLISSLQSAGVKISPQRMDSSVIHAVSPVFLPRGKPFVVTVGDIAPLTKWNSEWVDYSSIHAKLYSFYFSQITTRSFKHADAIIALSSQTAREICNVFPELASIVRMVSPGIGDKFRPGGTDIHEEIRIGYYREIHPMMQKVIDLLKERKVDFSLHSLTGVKEEDIINYYHAIDYFVDFMPYRGFGYPLVEARACGTSVMTRVDARIPDEVKELTIQVKDAYEAADKISSRVKEPYKPVSFSLENMAAKTIDVYKEVLKRRTP